jgi:hypothetical protein
MRSRSRTSLELRPGGGATGRNPAPATSSSGRGTRDRRAAMCERLWTPTTSTTFARRYVAQCLLDAEQSRHAAARGEQPPVAPDNGCPGVPGFLRQRDGPSYRRRMAIWARLRAPGYSGGPRVLALNACIDRDADRVLGEIEKRLVDGVATDGGPQRARHIHTAAAAALGLPPAMVATASTGAIGVPLPRDRVVAGSHRCSWAPLTRRRS